MPQGLEEEPARAGLSKKLLERSFFSAHPAESEAFERHRNAFAELNPKACLGELRRAVEHGLFGDSQDTVGNRAGRGRGEAPPLTQHPKRGLENGCGKRRSACRQHERIGGERSATLTHAQCETQVAGVLTGVLVKVQVARGHLTGLVGAELVAEKLGVARIQAVDRLTRVRKKRCARKLCLIQAHPHEVRERVGDVGES